MDLLEHDLSSVKLSVSHKTLDDMHPADIADIIEKLDPRLRSQVFATLDEEMAAEAMAELDDDETAAELAVGMEENTAGRIITSDNVSWHHHGNPGHLRHHRTHA